MMGLEMMLRGLGLDIPTLKAEAEKHLADGMARVDALNSTLSALNARMGRIEAALSRLERAAGLPAPICPTMLELGHDSMEVQ